MNQANPTPKTEIQKPPKEMKYPKYLVLITCTLLFGSYVVLYRAGSFSTNISLDKKQTLTFLKSELLEKYAHEDLSQANKVSYMIPGIPLPDIAQGDILEITFDYGTLAKESKNSKRLIPNTPVALIIISQGNREIINYFLKNQLRSEK